ncbi:MAG: DUF3089 domain-containing protein [Muribaculaceae bacterium]|nr:DUF3089 domain-containing protein [Muribaculaceae bacterium]
MPFICMVAAVLSSCGQTEPCQTVQPVYVPAAPDYSDMTFWHIDAAQDESGVDVFYIPSTWEYDWTAPSGAVSHWADPSNPKHRADVENEMTGVAEYMADGNRFYSPHYRHITLDSWATLDEDTINRRYHDVAYVDVRNAFKYFLEHFSQGRPFILAGFSQGGKSVVELMKTLTPEQQRRMVAAYVLGYKVTPDDVKAAPWIKAAEGECDTGVTVCYNSVSDLKYIKPIVSAPNVMCINPVNWKTDASPAILNDTITVTLSSPYNVLVLDGFDGSYLPNILDILNVGDYHGAEPWLYSECLRENFKRRINAYRSLAQ